jgi:cell division protein FtsB
MLQFYQQQTWRVLLTSPLALILLALLCLGMLRIVYERYSIEREMAARRFESELQLDALRGRKEQLAKKVEYLSNDRGIEAEMRRNFNVARPGEQVVIILDKEPESTIKPLDVIEQDTQLPWYQFWR